MTVNPQDGPPNPWVVLNDYSKTVITLSSGLLVITVTFSDQLLKSSQDPSLGNLLTGIWVSLILSILAGLLAAMFTINYLKHGKRDKLAILMSNTAFFLLVLAGILMVWFGIKRLSFSNQQIDLPAAIELAQQSLDAAINQSNGNWVVASVNFDKATDLYTIEMEEANLGVEYSVVVDKADRTVKQIHMITSP